VAYALKILVSAIIIVVVSELAKRSSLWAAILASLPLISLLAFIWLYLDTGDVQKISVLSQNIFWLVLPSLAFFVTLPLLIRMEINFWLSLLLASLITVLAYFVMLKILTVFSVRI